MMKRIVCALLTLIMVFSLVPTAALTVSAASVSNDLVEFVKNEEGFAEECHWDNAQYSIGFGTKCSGSDEDHANGIKHRISSEDEGEAMKALKKELESAAAAVSKFAAKYNLSLSQNQFDALVSFSYNCGTGWMNADGIFRQAVVGGKTGNDFLYAITLWSVGGVGLARRRLCEANMYLNGVYSNTAPSNYTYVRFNANGGSMEYSIQGYDTVEPVGVVETPTRNGYKFMGWYDANGEWITTLNANTAHKTLTARWQAIVGGGVSGGSVVGTPVAYAISASLASSLNIHKLPGTGAEIIGKAAGSDLLDVVAEYIDVDNVKWVKLKTGGWMSMGNVNTPVIQNYNVTVTVTNNYINVREKPSAAATTKILGKVYLNEKLRITEVTTVNNAKWGKFSGGWVALEYTDYDKVVTQAPVDDQGIESNGNETVIATGKVSVSTYVHVRKGPGTDKAAVNSIANGTLVTIYEVKTVGTSKWGRVNTGWICLDYVKLDENVKLPEDSTDTPVTEKVVATGVVNSNTNLNVRVAAGTEHQLVTTLPKGTKVNIFETTTTKGHTWGRIDKGWICLTYVTLDNSEQINGTGVKGTIVNCSQGANIRSAAGIGNALVGVAPVGSSVTVYQQTTVNGVNWGRIDKGWVCMEYVLLEGTVPGTGTGTGSGSTDTDNEIQIETSGIPTGTVAVESVDIYEKASASSEKIGVLIKGSKITASELVIEAGNIWGKTASGWVNMANITVNAYAVVTTKTGGQLNVRDASCDTSKEPVAKLDNGSQVNITAIKIANDGIWGRIDAEKDHWISLSLVKLNTKADTTVQPEQKPDTESKPVTPEVKPESTVKTGVIANTNYVNVRKAAGVRNDLVTTLARGTKVTVYEQVTKDNAPWGRIGENQWVAMVYVALDTTSIGGTTSGTTGGTTTTTHATGIVNSTINLNVRTGPGTQYAMITTLTKGTKINIYEQKLVNGMIWGRIDQGWVSLSYVTMTGSGSTGTGVMGTIARCYYAVNVRSAPGVGNALVGTIMVGSRVEIFEQQAYGGANWGRVSQGWISMDYVLLDSEIPGGTVPGAGTGSDSNTGTEQKPETDNKQPNYVTGFATGTVNHNSKDYLRILEKAETGSTEVASLINGTQITVSEMVVETSTGKVWGKVLNGWLNMAYVDVNAYAVVTTKTGGQLNVRDASCDTSKEPVAKLDNGSQVTITDVKSVGEGVWGLIDAEKGHWISLSLVKLNAQAVASDNTTNDTTTGGTNNGGTTTGGTTTGGTATGGVIGNTTITDGSLLYTGTVTGTVDGVRVRSTPSTKGQELGKLKNGTAVRIYEVAVAEYMAWGRCDSGWVCLVYVDLQSTKTDAVDARVVQVDGTVIRADAGDNYERLASYAKCTVVDIYEVKGNWGRTADGWVNLTHLLP